MSYPIVDHKGSPGCVKVAVIERQQILIFFLDALNNMGFALWKIPNVSFVQSIDFICAVLVDRSNENFALINIAPFCLVLGQSSQSSEVFSVFPSRGQDVQPDASEAL